ncbi:MAG: GtrA family protein [Planctomycetota bacterium]
MSIIELYQRTRRSLLTSVTSYPVARAAAIGVAMIWNFGCNRAITFRDAAEGPLLQQFWRFVVSCSLGAVVNWSTSLLLVSKIAFFREHVLLSAVAGVAAGYLLNFQLCRRWVFGAGPSE